jgi:predicted acetyltransferase
MALDLRPLSVDDKSQYEQLKSEAFRRGRIPPPINADEPRDLFVPFQLGIFEGDRLVAAGTVHDLRVSWGDRTAPLGGVAGVATVADQRGRGHVGRLLREFLIAMKDRGQYLSGLYPFAYGFYQAFGWDWVGERRVYTVPLALIPPFPEGGDVRRIAMPDALVAAKHVYAGYMRRYRGMTTREAARPDWWDGLNDRGGCMTYVHVYENPATSEPEGYLAFRFPEANEPAEVGDFFANTAQAYRGLLSVLHYYGNQIKAAEWEAPLDDFLPMMLTHRDIITQVKPMFMGRIVDVAPAFENLAIAGDIAPQATVVLDLADPVCPWNTGRFAIDSSGDGIHVARTDAPAGVSLDIRTLSQAYWGHPSLDVLRHAGRVTVNDEAQFTTLSRFLPPVPCYLQDFF